MKNRMLNRTYARLGGYFWLPCPLCDDHFGGHEWKTGGPNLATIPVLGEPAYGQGICPDCTDAGRGWDNTTWDGVAHAVVADPAATGPVWDPGLGIAVDNRTRKLWYPAHATGNDR